MPPKKSTFAQFISIQFGADVTLSHCVRLAHIYDLVAQLQISFNIIHLPAKMYEIFTLL